MQISSPEGSFHGRMLISLSSTWNPAKRAPFEWDEYLTALPLPKFKSDRLNVEFDKNWLVQWETKAPLVKTNQVMIWRNLNSVA